jgi:hypothetical protein
MVAPKKITDPLETMLSSTIVEMVILFANGEVVPDSGQENLVAVDHESTQAQFYKNVSAQRTRVRLILDAAVEGIAALNRMISGFDRIIESDFDLALYPNIETRDGKGRRVLKWDFKDPSRIDKWAMLAAIVIRDTTKGDQTDIGRCHLEECGDYFQIIRGGMGKPNRKYCCSEHMRDAHKLGSTERSRIKRERDRQKLTAKKARRTPVRGK